MRLRAGGVPAVFSNPYPPGKARDRVCHRDERRVDCSLIFGRTRLFVTRDFKCGSFFNIPVYREAPVVSIRLCTRGRVI